MFFKGFGPPGGAPRSLNGVQNEFQNGSILEPFFGTENDPKLTQNDPKLVEFLGPAITKKLAFRVGHPSKIDIWVPCFFR